MIFEKKKWNSREFKCSMCCRIKSQCEANVNEEDDDDDEKKKNFV